MSRVLSEREQQTFAIIKDAARRGAPLPSNSQIAASMGASVSMPSFWIKRLERLGLIQVNRARGLRHVTVVGTGDVATTRHQARDAASGVTANEMATLEFVSRAAERGDACPTNREIAEHVGKGYTTTRGGQWLLALADAGLIVIENAGGARRVTIVATGHVAGRHPRSIFAPQHAVIPQPAPRSGLTGSQERVLALIEAAANRGMSAPTNEQLTGRLGFNSRSTASAVVRGLERKGRIAVERFRTWRRITIVATGKVTATVGNTTPHAEAGKPCDTAPRKPNIVQSEALPPRVDRDPCGWCGVRRDVGCHHHPKGE